MTRPIPIQFNPDGVPAELRERPQWVAWRCEGQGPKPRKVPYVVRTGAKADYPKPEAWCSFEEAVAALRGSDRYEGIGFVISADDPYCGIDLDDAVVDGQLIPSAQAIVDAFSTYTETSPSGTGVKLIAIGKKPDDAKCNVRNVDGMGGVEVYDEKRFWTITGQRLEGTPPTIGRCQQQINDLCSKLWPKRPTQSSENGEAVRRGAGGTDMASRERRCLAYIQKCPDAISGNRGHDLTLRAACECFRFGLDDAATWRVMRSFNDHKTGGEQWSDKELAHKIDDARRKVEESGEFGVRLVDLQFDEKVKRPEAIAALMTDVGNAARFVRDNGARVRFCFGPNHWLIWDGRRWKRDDRGHALTLAKRTALAILDEAKRAGDDSRDRLIDWAKKSQTKERLQAMLYLAQPDVAVVPDELDVDPYAFNCKNGTIDLRTGKLQPHSQDDLITKISLVAFDQNASCPRFDQFLAEIFGDDIELIGFVQRWHGYCLTGDVCEQLLPIYHGEGNNGKSVLLDTISAVMGDYAGEAPPDLLTVRKHPEHPTEIADLFGMRLAIASESERGAELRVQLIKRLTGNARLKARLMRRDYFEFARTHKLILVTNNRPIVKEDTEAVWRRLRLVPFGIVIPKDQRDPELLTKLQAEAPGILAWMVRGCVDWCQRGLCEPATVMAATEAYRGASNSADEFLRECCVFGDNLRIASSTLADAYTAWCARRERVALQGSAFAAVLRVRGCEPRKWKGDRHWFGVSLSDSWTELPELTP
jgi:putative DNA primase/helicase